MGSSPSPFLRAGAPDGRRIQFGGTGEKHGPEHSDARRPCRGSLRVGGFVANRVGGTRRTLPHSHWRRARFGAERQTFFLRLVPGSIQEPTLRPQSLDRRGSADPSPASSGVQTQQRVEIQDQQIYGSCWKISISSQKDSGWRSPPTPSEPSQK